MNGLQWSGVLLLAQILTIYVCCPLPFPGFPFLVPWYITCCVSYCLLASFCEQVNFLVFECPLCVERVEVHGSVSFCEYAPVLTGTVVATSILVVARMPNFQLS